MRGVLAENVYGPVLIGLAFNILMCGIILTQGYIYYTTYKRRDPLWIKIFILVLFLISLFNTVVNMDFVYDGVILHFDNPEYLKIATWPIMAAPVMTGMVGAMVQLFYVSRIHALIQKWFLTVIVIALSFTGVAGALVTTWEVARTPIYEKFQSWSSIIITWLGCAAAADIIIAGSLVWHLHTHKTGFKNSDMVIDRMIRVTVQTGLLTAIVAITNMIVFIGDSTGTHLMFNTPLSNLYLNSLLSNLNSREGWKLKHSVSTTSRQGNSEVSAFHADVMSSKMSMSPPRVTQFKNPTAGRSRPEVFVHVESHESRDVILVQKRPSDTLRDLEADGESSSMEGDLDARYPTNRVGRDWRHDVPRNPM